LGTTYRTDVTNGVTKFCELIGVSNFIGVSLGPSVVKNILPDGADSSLPFKDTAYI
jgi:hypothetical protein